MKKINTECVSNIDANLDNIKYIIDNLFTKDSEEWLCVYDTSIRNKDYIQIHSNFGEGSKIVVNFLENVLNYSKDEIDEVKNIYLIEYRKYQNGENFRHYRGFFPNSDLIYSYFEKYMKDEEIDVDGWYDVTDEFIDKKEKNNEIRIFIILILIELVISFFCSI